MSDIDTYDIDDVDQQDEGWQSQIAQINRNLVRGMAAALVVIAVGMVLAVLFLLGWLDRSSDSERITDLEDSQERLFAGYDQLFDQVEGLGEEPVVPPPEDVVDTPSNEPEIQEQERQDPERQEPEIQDSEIQDSEVNDPDPFDDPDPDDPVDLAALGAAVNQAVAEFCTTVGCPDPVDDPEIQDPEIQDPEIQDPEIQDPEINDPDPDDPGGQCPAGTTPTELRVATGDVDAPGQIEFVTIIACVPTS